LHVKICGITRLDDAVAAIGAGADMLGFNFYALSARYVKPAACAQIVEALRARGLGACTVGVFVNARAAEIIELAQRCRLDLAQLHGDEPPELLRMLNAEGVRAFKAIRLPKGRGDDGAEGREREMEAIRRFLFPMPCSDAQVPSLLADAGQAGRYGGTSETGDWAAAAEIAARSPILLAGGLTPENVAAAIERVRPWGVDVASGVEASPAKKDARKLAAFVAAARQALGGRQGQTSPIDEGVKQ
jgi:phosphoribosylanthranilate isomerase